MTPEILKGRFKGFALEVVRFVSTLPYSEANKAIKYQVIRCSTSSVANYRAACRRKSRRDFIAKMGIVEEELDETLFWLEFIAALTPDTRPLIGPIWKEGNELLAITVATIKTSRKGLTNP